MVQSNYVKSPACYIRLRSETRIAPTKSSAIVTTVSGAIMTPVVGNFPDGVAPPGVEVALPLDVGVAPTEGPAAGSVGSTDGSVGSADGLAPVPA